MPPFTGTVQLEPTAFNHTSTDVEGRPWQPIGAIGLPILENYNLFLDFPHSVIFASNDHFSVQQASFLSDNLLAAPFVLHRDGILFPVKTDAGTYHLLLDTGSTRTVIRKPHPTTTAQFLIAGHDFGTRRIFPIDLNPKHEFDGCLGLDCLREHPVFYRLFQQTPSHRFTKKQCDYRFRTKFLTTVGKVEKAMPSFQQLYPCA